MNNKTKVVVITFAVFMSEAIIHYNIGAHKHTKDNKFALPPPKDLLKIGAICAVFSLINGIIVSKMTNNN
jgi:hypothetical protein